MSTKSREQAEAGFKKREAAAREEEKAKQQREAEAKSVTDKTARLRALRLAKEAADLKAAPPKKPAVRRKKAV